MLWREYTTSTVYVETKWELRELHKERASDICRELGSL